MKKKKTATKQQNLGLEKLKISDVYAYIVERSYCLKAYQISLLLLALS